MVMQAVIHLSTFLVVVCANPLQGEEKTMQYLKKYGYLNNMNMSEGLKSFQKLSGLTETGSLDDDTVSQMGIARCGGKDNSVDEAHKNKVVLRYTVTKYPESSLLSGDNIDNVVLTAANLWQTDLVKIVKNTDGDIENDVEIVFCDFSECLEDYSVENDGEELARPVTKDGKMTLYLDSAQSWADETTLSQLSYGGVMHLQIQLLQVILHQFGHVLGLEHSARMSSAMVPFYMEWVNGLQPDKEDLEMVGVASRSRLVRGHCGIIVMAVAVIMTSLII